jgi:hypothetical protein
MLPPKLTLPPDQQRLLRLFKQLGATEQRSLLDFAEFLAMREAQQAAQPPAADSRPANIPRPPSESVVAAIRRLSKTFPMLDREALLHETSALMTAHVMQGRPAADVIDELEAVFRRHYRQVKSMADQQAT